MKKQLATLPKLLDKMLLALAFALCGLPASAEEISLRCQWTLMEPLRKVAATWETMTGHKVVITESGENSTLVLDDVRKELANPDSDVDIHIMDSAWIGLVADQLVDLRQYTSGTEQLHLPSIIEAYTVNGRLAALPLYTDVGVMYFRQDLLAKYNAPVPFTWEALANTAERIVTAERAAGNGALCGLIFQGLNYEGLTCCALEWINSHGGGTLIDADGSVTISNPRAEEALRRVAGWMGSIVPMETLTYKEEESRLVFHSGNAVFMRNWQYPWFMAQAEDSPVRGKIGVMPIPMGFPGGRSSSALGGWGLAVFKQSRHKEAAADLVMYLTGPQGQRELCTLESYIPSVTSLFEDPRITVNNPMAIREILNFTISRPVGVTGSLYPQVSREFSTAVHAVLRGETDAATALQQLEETLNRLKGMNWN